MSVSLAANKKLELSNPYNMSFDASWNPFRDLHSPPERTSTPGFRAVREDVDPDDDVEMVQEPRTAPEMRQTSSTFHTATLSQCTDPHVEITKLRAHQASAVVDMTLLRQPTKQDMDALLSDLNATKEELKTVERQR